METDEMMNKMEETGQTTMNRLQDTAKNKFAEVSHRMSDVSQKMAERSREAATRTDHYVHEYAWSSVALAALLGIAIGLMLRRS